MAPGAYFNDPTDGGCDNGKRKWSAVIDGDASQWDGDWTRACQETVMKGGDMKGSARPYNCYGSWGRVWGDARVDDPTCAKKQAGKTEKHRASHADSDNACGVQDLVDSLDITRIDDKGCTGNNKEYHAYIEAKNGDYKSLRSCYADWGRVLAPKMRLPDHPGVKPYECHNLGDGAWCKFQIPQDTTCNTADNQQKTTGGLVKWRQKEGSPPGDCQGGQLRIKARITGDDAANKTYNTQDKWLKVAKETNLGGAPPQSCWKIGGGEVWCEQLVPNATCSKGKPTKGEISKAGYRWTRDGEGNAEVDTKSCADGMRTITAIPTNESNELARNDTWENAGMTLGSIPYNGTDRDLKLCQMPWGGTRAICQAEFADSTCGVAKANTCKAPNGYGPQAAPDYSGTDLDDKYLRNGDIIYFYCPSTRRQMGVTSQGGSKAFTSELYGEKKAHPKLFEGQPGRVFAGYTSQSPPQPETFNNPSYQYQVWRAECTDGNDKQYVRTNDLVYLTNIQTGTHMHMKGLCGGADTWPDFSGKADASDVLRELQGNDSLETTHGFYLVAGGGFGGKGRPSATKNDLIKKNTTQYYGIAAAAYRNVPGNDFQDCYVSVAEVGNISDSRVKSWGKWQGSNQFWISSDATCPPGQDKLCKGKSDMGYAGKSASDAGAAVKDAAVETAKATGEVIGAALTPLAPYLIAAGVIVTVGFGAKLYITTRAKSQ